MIHGADLAPWRIFVSTSTFAVAQPKRRWYLDPGALRPLYQSYMDHLVFQGYREATLFHLSHSARHFCYWLNQSDIAVARVDETVIKQFATHRCKCPGDRASETMSAPLVGCVRKFVGFLEKSGVVHLPMRTTGDGRLQPYLDWLRQHRGLSEVTIDGCRKHMTHLLPLLGSDPRTYDAARVRSVILAETRRRTSVDMKGIVTVLRSYLRYLITQGQCPASLVQAVPSVCHSKYSNIPKFLPAAKVEKLINSCDMTTPAGIRDRAILLLLARLGLRAGDIFALCFDDIDWQNGTVRVCGKGRRQVNLPLPQDVGDALLKYLTEARPKVPIAKVFLRSLAPCRPLLESSTAVTTIVRRALVRAGINDAPMGGARLLRNSAATNLLHAGAPLETIGTILRHRSINTTGFYAKVDFRALKQIAQPWPGGASC
jgi:site-specific recombinase XerD